MVVFYVGIVVLLIGTNLRAGGAGRGARFKKHVVEYTEGTGAESRYVVTIPHLEFNIKHENAKLSSHGGTPIRGNMIRRVRN